MSLRVLIVARSPEVGETLCMALAESDSQLELAVADSPDEAIQRVQDQPWDCVLIEGQIAGGSCSDLVTRLHETRKHLMVAVISQELSAEAPALRELGAAVLTAEGMPKGPQLSRFIWDSLGNAAIAAAELPATEALDLGPDRLLVVDDEEIIHMTLERMLRGTDIEIDHAYCADEALEKMSDGFGVVLTDIRMPGKDGIELVRQIKQLDPRVEVIVMTGYASLDTAMRATRHGARSYITKPIDDHATLLDELRGGLRQWKDSRQNEELYSSIVRGYLETFARDGQGRGIEFVRKGGAELAFKIMGALNDGVVFLADDDNVDFCNVNLAQRLSIPYLELLGAPLGNHVTEQDRPALSAFVAQIRKLGRGTTRDLHLQSQAGVRIPVMIQGLVLPGDDDQPPTVILILTDLTDLQQAQARTEMLASLLDLAPSDAIITYDQRGQITYANRAAEQLFGCSVPELLASGADDRIRGASMTELLERQDAAAAAQPTEAEAINSDGSLIPISLTVSVASSELEPGKRGMAFIRDIRDSREAQRLVEQHQAERDRAREELERLTHNFAAELVQSSERVAEHLSHLDREIQQSSDNEQRQRLEAAVDEVRRLRHVSEGLLAWSNAGKKSVSSNKVDLDTLLKDALSERQDDIAASGARIEAEKLPSVCGSTEKLRRLLGILIDNALIHRSDGSPTIQVKSQRQNDQWLISVHDDGPGIKPGQEEEIFGVLRYSNRDDRQPSGAGLGLAIARRIVLRHGGQIWVESDPDRGATFFFSMPDNAEPETPGS